MVGKVPSKHYIALDFHKQKTHSILFEYVFEGLKPLSVEYSFSIKPASSSAAHSSMAYDHYSLCFGSVRSGASIFPGHQTNTCKMLMVI